MTGWQVGEIPLTTTRGKQIAAGWVRGHFGLDFRVMLNSEDAWQGGWAITHIPTGYVMRRIFSSLPVAKAYTDAVAEKGDWSFTGLDQHTLAPLGRAVKAAMAAFPGVEIVGGVEGEMAPSNLPVAPVTA